MTRYQRQKGEGSGRHLTRRVQTDAFLRGVSSLARATGEDALPDSASKLTCIMHAAAGVKMRERYLAK